MGKKISSVTIENFKSIKDLNDFELNNINILIGPNGAGKSNFVSFFRILNQIAQKRLQVYLPKSGYAEKVLHFGSKNSDFLGFKVEFGKINKYEAQLEPTEEDSLIFSYEEASFNKGSMEEPTWHQDFAVRGNEETYLYTQIKKNKKQRNGYGGISEYVLNAFQSFKIYHFHDTSSSSPMKKASDINEVHSFNTDGSNLAAFLYYLKETNTRYFERIEKVIQLIAPFFKSFVLEPDPWNKEKIFLRWQEKDSDNYFDANQLSDGTLRMICLTTLMMQPEPPDTVIIDEPELGLHPYAINVLSSIMEQASHDVQIIASTQSTTFINNFTPEDVIVIDRENHQSKFRRLNTYELEEWLEDYTLGEIWEKNIIKGRP